MKLFIGLSVLFIVNFVSGAHIISRNYIEPEQQVISANQYAKENVGINRTELEYLPKCSSLSDCVNDELFEVMCNANKSNGQWLVIQRRVDGKTNFYRNWKEYKAGFGNMTGEFWIGLENLHLLTTCAPQELLVEIEDFDNKKLCAKYDLFEVGGERELYALNKVGNQSGNAGNPLSFVKNEKFSTYDLNNSKSKFNYAQEFKGGWWYGLHTFSNLNGEYGNTTDGKGIFWSTSTAKKPTLKFVEMKIRPKME